MSALKVLARSQALSENLTVPLGASGGTPPYAFSVIPGGAGGTIATYTGVYTSPSKSGIDTIQVADSLGATATLGIKIGSPLKLVCDIVQSEMGLDDDQVYLWDQKFNIPNDSRIYVPIGVLTCKPFGSSLKMDSLGRQVQSVNMYANLSIDILSRSLDAVNRKEEVLMALNSFYSESQQEINSFRVFPLSNNFINLSDEEGAAILYRFNISVAIQYMVTKQSALEYYDDFPGAEVTTEP